MQRPFGRAIRTTGAYRCGEFRPYRAIRQSPLQVSIEAGPTLYFNDIRVDTSLGYGISYYSWLAQWVDAIKLPLSARDMNSGKQSSSWTADRG